ncbi:MAG: hypothetical protein AB198_01390 [Parcubacteria bacterium C7867-003]|nr:MAG: hypothetical protein AB198_01390 [Parcubacteria bacterium C7867-003]
MFEYLEKLRQKPDSTKKKIAFLGSFIFTGIIFAFWLLAVYPSFKEDAEIQKKAKSLETSPISSLGSILGDNFSKIKEQISSLKDLGSSFSKEMDYYIASSTVSATASTTLNEQ